MDMKKESLEKSLVKEAKEKEKARKRKRGPYRKSVIYKPKPKE
jgi:hypothetical protein